MQDIHILEANADYTVCIKPSGVTSEDGDKCGMPTLLSKTGAKPFVVHRLDREVSGVMVFANTVKAAAELSRQITDKTFKKEYLAVIEGEVSEKGDLEDLLYHDRIKNKTYTVKRERKGVKRAKLEFERLATAHSEHGVLSLVKIKLYTGRTHQIRVQFGSRKHPVFGDRKYGSVTGGEVALFSHAIGFNYNKKEQIFTALPNDSYPWTLFGDKISEIKK